jgi:predicted neuraminidase
MAAAGADWTIVDHWNAIPSGSEKAAKSLAACEDLAAKNGDVQFSFNLDSKHCYTSSSTDFRGLANDHVTSGCIASSVSNCKAPEPTPPPAPTPPAPAPPAFDGVVRAQKDGTSAAYLIPPYKQNHASTIEQLPDGTIAVAWFSGEKEEADGCAIVFATLSAGSKQFTKAATLSERDGYSNQNPVLFYDIKTSILHLYHSQAPAKSGESKSTIQELTSTDNGKTWTKPKTLFDFPGAFPRNRIIPSLDGGLLFPIYNAGKDNIEHDNYAIIEKSNAAHTNWTQIDIKNSQGKVQPTCVRLNNKNVRCWFRDRAAGFIYMSESTDDAATWSKPTKTELPNPNVGIEANVLTSGNIVMVFNNYNKSTEGSHGRTPLNVAISKDNGTSWQLKDLQVHDDDKSTAEGHLEYSYPSVLQTSSDGNIHITYTYDRNTIKYRRVTEEWILSK